jgi:hypothetical protein
MKKLCLFIFISLGGYAGWRLGASFGIMTAYFISLIGSLAGVIVGCIINRKYLDL